MAQTSKSYWSSWFSSPVKSELKSLNPAVASEVPLDNQKLVFEPSLSLPDLQVLSTRLQNNRLEQDRKERYKLYSEMQDSSLLSHAFQIYLSELAGDSLSDEKFRIASDSKQTENRVQALLDALRLDRYIYELVRQLITYGDCFLEVLVDKERPELGIQGIRLLNPNLVYRVEDAYGLLQGFVVEVPRNVEEQRFGAYSDASQFIALDKNQVLHFRLFTADPAHAPYGRSIAAAVRKDFKKLSLLQDAMLIYRMSRAPSRFVFSVDTGNLPASKAQIYLQQQKDALRNQMHYDRNGAIDMKSDLLSITDNFFIAVNGKGSGSKIERLPSDSSVQEISDILLMLRQICAGLNLKMEQVLGDDAGRGSVQQLGIAFSDTVDAIRADLADGLTELARRHLILVGDSNWDTARLAVTTNNDLRHRRNLDKQEQIVRLAQAQKSIGIIPIEVILKDTLGLTPTEIDDYKAKLVTQQEELAFEQMLSAQKEVGGSSPDAAQLNKDAGEQSALGLSMRQNRRGENKQVPSE